MDWEGERVVKRKLKNVWCADTIHSKGNSRDRPLPGTKQG